MALSSDNVRVAVTGKVYVGPTTADAPTSSASVLDTDFVELGYIGESGVTESRSRSTSDIKAWQNGDVVRTVVSEGKITYKFVLIETTKTGMETFYGATTAGATPTDGRLDVVPTATGGRKSFLFDIEDGAEDLRAYVKQGEVTEVGDVVYQSGQPIGREVTVTAYPVNGVAVQIWSTALKTA